MYHRISRVNLKSRCLLLGTRRDASNDTITTPRRYQVRAEAQNNSSSLGKSQLHCLSNERFTLMSAPFHHHRQLSNHSRPVSIKASILSVHRRVWTIIMACGCGCCPSMTTALLGLRRKFIPAMNCGFPMSVCLRLLGRVLDCVDLPMQLLQE